MIDRASKIQSWLTNQVGAIPKWGLGALVGSIVLSIVVRKHVRNRSQNAKLDENEGLSNS